MSGCAPLVISFQDQSTGDVAAWRWDFGNGSTSTLKNPSTTYFTAGTYSVSLTVSNQDGSNTLTRQAFVTVYDRPAVQFTADRTTGCFPIQISFTDATTVGSASAKATWQWDFGNGTQSAEASPKVKYDKSGNYTISLRVATDKGCFATLTKPAYVHISGALQPSFTNTAVNRCQAPFPVQFTNGTTGPGTLSYEWNFGDGNTSAEKNPAHAYTAPGSYTVSLVTASSDGCRDTVRKTNLVTIPAIRASFTAANTVCANQPQAFTNTSSPAAQSTLWRFGDGGQATTVNASRSYATAGTYTVQLINRYNHCSDTATKDITVLARPKAGYSADSRSHCKPPFTVRFSDASQNAVAWLWRFGDGNTSAQQNPEHTYTAYGNYTVTLLVTNSDGCIDSLRQTAYIQVRKPVISFASLPRQGCVPFATTLSANINTPDRVTSYSWNFGDGGTSTAASPAHTYTEQGSYPVSLTITTSLGCTDSARVNNAVVAGRRPVIDFTASANPACAFQEVQYAATATEGSTWAWTFGGIGNSSQQNPVVIYKEPGVYPVTLSVTNNGCRETLTRSDFMTVKPPVAAFEFEKDCSSPKQFNLKDKSNAATAWSWDFGDGNTSTEQNPVHFYTDFGTYTISLTATNEACSHTIKQTVSAFESPLNIKANVQEACKTATIQFTSEVEDSSRIVAYQWAFFNGSTGSAARHPQATYHTAGDYAVRLVTTDIYGCTDTALRQKFIRINGPVAAISATNNVGCKGLTANFRDNSATDGRHQIVQRLWQYGDGRSESFDTENTAQHLYPNPGDYAVQLVVTDAAGCRDSVRVANLVRTSAPVVDFSTPDTLVCLGSNVQFFNRSSALNAVSEWRFGNGGTSSLASPAYRYTDTGTYDVRLKITDANGCSDSLTKRRVVRINKTKAAFEASSTVGVCLPYEVRFTNNSAFYTQSNWNFGPATSTATHPRYTFLEAGTFAVKLYVTGRGGCIDSATRLINIYDDSTTRLTYTPIEGCKPVRIKASVSSPARIDYTWDFGDGTLVKTKEYQTEHTYTGVGDFLPRLIISDSGNCLLPFTGADTVSVKGAITKFGFDKRFFCDSGAVQFLDSTQYNDRGITWQWHFGDGQTSAEQSPRHQYRQPGLYTVTLLAKTSSGCSDSTVIEDLVKVVQSPVIRISGDTALCKDESLVHTALNLRPDTSAVQWYWRFPNGALAAGMRPPPQRYATPGDFIVQAIAVNSSGCADTATHRLVVHSLPVVSIPASMTVIAGTPTLVEPVNYSANIASYRWTPTAGLSCDNCPQPLLRPSFNTTYKLQVTDSNGCRSSTEMQVVVVCKASNVFIPNTFSPNADGSNDVFYIRGSGLARVKSLRIFNRLGQVVFERHQFGVNDLSAGWDGSYKGKALAPDNYIYQAEIFCENSEVLSFNGTVVLIR